MYNITKTWKLAITFAIVMVITLSPSMVLGQEIQEEETWVSQEFPLGVYSYAQLEKIQFCKKDECISLAELVGRFEVTSVTATIFGGADETRIKGFPKGSLRDRLANGQLAQERGAIVFLFLFDKGFRNLNGPVGYYPKDRRVKIVFTHRIPTGLCGDGIVSHGEQCDDGNINDGDGCDRTCHLEFTAGDQKQPIFGVGLLVLGRLGYVGGWAGGGLELEFYPYDGLTFRLEGTVSAPFRDDPDVDRSYKLLSPTKQLGISLTGELTYTVLDWLEVGAGFSYWEAYTIAGHPYLPEYNASWRVWEVETPVRFNVWNGDGGEQVSLFVRLGLGASHYNPSDKLSLFTFSGVVGLTYQFGAWPN